MVSCFVLYPFTCVKSQIKTISNTNSAVNSTRHTTTKKHQSTNKYQAGAKHGLHCRAAAVQDELIQIWREDLFNSKGAAGGLRKRNSTPLCSTPSPNYDVANQHHNMWGVRPIIARMDAGRIGLLQGKVVRNIAGLHRGVAPTDFDRE